MDQPDPNNPSKPPNAQPRRPGAPRGKPTPPHITGSSGSTPEAVTLVKAQHRWVFRCDPGDETALLCRLSELAGRPDVPFDWFDAALVSHQLSKRLKPGLNRIDGKNRPASDGT